MALPPSPSKGPANPQPPDTDALPVALPCKGALQEGDLRRLATQQAVDQLADIIIDYYLAWKRR